METIVEIITENCASVETRVILKHSQICFINRIIHKAVNFACKDDRTVCLFGSPEAKTSVFELLMHPERLSAIKIGGDIYYLQWYTRYKAKRVDDGLLVDIRFPLHKSIE